MQHDRYRNSDVKLTKKEIIIACTYYVPRQINVTFDIKVYKPPNTKTELQTKSVFLLKSNNRPIIPYPLSEILSLGMRE
jgi:hypothetical protein